MQHLIRVHAGLDVTPILAQLDAQPDLWNANAARLGAAGPMAGTGDIWLRYFPPATLTEPAAFLREGRCEFYPAWHALPAIAPIAYSLMGMCSGVELGGCLISRIPPGGEIKEHVDGAAWSARYYNRKFYVPLRANEQCINTCGDEQAVFRVGEVWEFDNLVRHAVYNRGETVRETLIITLRAEV